MAIAGLVLAVLAALLHVFIFYLESLVWTSAKARAVFGTSPQAAEATKEMAFNQGFYNLFLAVQAFVGVLLYATGHGSIGRALVFAGAGAMAAAALVLLVSSPDKRSAAIKQGVLPSLAVLLLALSSI